jgi:hypothetical protein
VYLLLPLVVHVTQYLLVLIAVVERFEAVKARPTELRAPAHIFLPHDVRIFH